MSIFGGLATPEWLSPQKESLLSGEEARATAHTWMQAAQLGLQEQQQKLETQQALQQMAVTGQKLQSLQKASWEEAQDKEKIIPWLATHNTWDKFQTGDAPTPLSPWGLDAMQQARIGFSQSLGKEVAVKSVEDFTSRLHKISPEYASKILNLPAGPNNQPSSQQWDALNLAERLMSDTQRKQKLEDEKALINTRESADYMKITAEQKNVKAIQEAEALAQAAKEAGNEVEYNRQLERANLLRAAQPTHKKRTITTGFSPEGVPTVTDTEEDVSGEGAPTKGTQTTIQSKILKYENAMQLLTKLDKNLDWKSVGPQGAIGEKLGDELLANFMPGAASKDRIQTRQILRSFRETMLRELGDDRRFSARDREEIAQALPESGVFESLPDAKAKLGTVRTILIERARNAAEIGRQPIPDFAKTPLEIKADYQKQKLAIQKAQAAGTITKDDADAKLSEASKKAEQLLIDYH